MVYTISGQIVEELKQVSVDQSIELGKMYEKGIYIIEVIQGGERAVVRVIKH
ncbi:MAG: T9SS type A sorting domain-containing protein [Sphingobacteriales bacterium]